MYEVISMSNRELDRLKMIEQMALKLINQRQAADILNLSTRQVKRLVKEHKIHSP
jgi:transcriptional regulator with GAF, ATPase, and Fis domain